MPDERPAATPVRFAAVRAARDVGLLGGWLAASHVAAWWNAPDAAAYLADAVARPHQRSWLVLDDDGPFGYVETYAVAEDPIAEHAPVARSDRGFHVLLGDPHRRGTGAADRLLRATVCGLMAEPGVERVLCEPDVQNGRMLAFCARNGGRTACEFDFGGRKRAALVVWDRAEVRGRWPDGLAVAEAASRRWDALDREPPPIGAAPGASGAVAAAVQAGSAEEHPPTRPVDVLGA